MNELGKILREVLKGSGLFQISKREVSRNNSHSVMLLTSLTQS